MPLLTRICMCRYKYIFSFLLILVLVLVWDSPKEIRHGEEIAWYADGETIVRSEHNPSIAYAYGNFVLASKYSVMHSYVSQVFTVHNIHFA